MTHEAVPARESYIRHELFDGYVPHTENNFQQKELTNEEAYIRNKSAVDKTFHRQLIVMQDGKILSNSTDLATALKAAAYLARKDSSSSTSVIRIPAPDFT